jgi:hypothetical protein
MQTLAIQLPAEVVNEVVEENLFPGRNFVYRLVVSQLHFDGDTLWCNAQMGKYEEIVCSVDEWWSKVVGERPFLYFFKRKVKQWDKETRNERRLVPVWEAFADMQIWGSGHQEHRRGYHDVLLGKAANCGVILTATLMDQLIAPVDVQICKIWEEVFAKNGQFLSTLKMKRA